MRVPHEGIRQAVDATGSPVEAGETIGRDIVDSLAEMVAAGDTTQRHAELALSAVAAKIRSDLDIFGQLATLARRRAETARE